MGRLNARGEYRWSKIDGSCERGVGNVDIRRISNFSGNLEIESMLYAESIEKRIENFIHKKL